MSAPTVQDWTDLSTRQSGGLDVSLCWSPSTGRVKVVVARPDGSDLFQLEVDRADALEAFYHPFAFRSRLGCVAEHVASACVPCGPGAERSY